MQVRASFEVVYSPLRPFLCYTWLVGNLYKLECNLSSQQHPGDKRTQFGNLVQFKKLPFVRLRNFTTNLVNLLIPHTHHPPWTRAQGRVSKVQYSAMTELERLENGFYQMQHKKLMMF